MTVDRKKMIIEAATKSFTLFGYKATTIEQVAKLANVGKGTIYTFFKNKEELFDEIVVTLIEDMKAEAEKVIDPALMFFENAHRALYRILEFRLEHQLTIKLFQEEREMGTPAVQEVMVKLEASIITYIRKWIELAIANGKIQPCDPEITAFIIYKLYIALIFDWEKRHEPLDKDKIFDLFHLYIIKGLSN